MWLCIISEMTVEIVGCPENGIAAIDFRRQHQLPDNPRNTEKLPSYEWSDEEFVRRLAEFADCDADLLAYRLQFHWYVAGDKLYHIGKTSSGRYLRLSAAIVRDYLREQTPETGRALFLDLLAISLAQRHEALAEYPELACRLDNETGANETIHLVK